MKLRLDSIDVQGSSQTRVAMDEATVLLYMEGLRNRVVFPPIDVFQKGDARWMGDGFHRLEAHRRLKIKLIDCTVHRGGPDEALLFAAAANDTHGLRRTQEDKRRAVVLVLGRFGKWGDRKIAKAIGVSHPFVGMVRQSTKIGANVTTRLGADGRSYSAESVVGRPSTKPQTAVLKEIAEKHDIPLEVVQAYHDGVQSLRKQTPVAIQLAVDAARAVFVAEGELTADQWSNLLLRAPEDLVRERAREIKKAEKADRIPDDAYLTPIPLARAITIRVRELLEDWHSFNPSLHAPRRILEPAWGGGAFGRAVREQWPKAKITAVDIRKVCKPEDPSVEWHHSDFLDFDPGGEPFDLILTNPPYNLADAFRTHALNLVKPGGMVALLLGVNYLDGQERAKTVWSDTSGAYLAPIAPRPDFSGDGGGNTGYALFAWTKGIDEPGELDRAITWEREP